MTAGPRPGPRAEPSVNDVSLEPDCTAFCASITAMPAMQEWIAAAKAEPDELEELDVEF
jgi:glutathione S-transferase